MLQPKSKLPFEIDSTSFDFGMEIGDKCNVLYEKFEEGSNRKAVGIIDTNDVEYVKECCNNFLKAVSLLELSIENFKSEYGELEDYEYTWKPIEEFLKLLK